MPVDKSGRTSPKAHEDRYSKGPGEYAKSHTHQVHGIGVMLRQQEVGDFKRDAVLALVIIKDQAHHESHHARVVGHEVDREEKPVLASNNEIFTGHDGGLAIKPLISKQRQSLRTLR